MVIILKVKKINTRSENVFRVLCIIGCIGLIFYKFLYQGSYAFAKDMDVKIDLNNDGNSEKVEFNNNRLIIYDCDGKVIFQKDEGENYYCSIAFVKDKTIKDTKILLQSRTTDTSGLLSYSILKMEGNELKEVIHKEDIYKGIITVADNTNIVEEVPVYSEDDSNAVPSYTSKSYFSLEDNKLVPLKKEKLSYKPYGDASISSEYYKNPSHDKIEKLLEDVAYEKGIPVGILKAIAWQESKGSDKDNSGTANWRQFSNGQPLISYDHIGIGIMQVSDYGNKSTAYVNRLKYDTEFNIREGVEILLVKWSLQNASVTYKIPKVGNASPNYLEHWYYTIWAYNGYSSRNNPASNHAKAYQTLVIGHANNIFNTHILDLFVYKPSLFTAGVLPRTDIEEISGKNSGGLKIKDENHKYIATKILTITDENMNKIGSCNQNDVVTIKGNPIIKNAYVRYYVEGSSKSGYVMGNWLRPVGNTNGDRQVDIYDFVKQSKNINGSGTVVNDDNRISIENSDVNMDGVVNIKDSILAAGNYNFYLYKNDIKN